MIPLDFFERALIGYVSDLNRQIKEIGANVPAYILNTGDEAYLIENLRNLESIGTTQYEQTPRMVIQPAGISFDISQSSNPHVRGNLTIDSNSGSTEFSSALRRISSTWELETEIVTDNLPMSLKYLQLFTMLLFKANVYEFQYLGKQCKGSYLFTANVNQNKNIELGFNVERRNRNLTFNVDLELQLPSFDLSNSANGLLPDGADSDNEVTWTHIVKDINPNTFTAIQTITPADRAAANSPEQE